MHANVTTTYYIKNMNTLFIETQTSKKLENVYFTTMHVHTYVVMKQLHIIQYDNNLHSVYPSVNVDQT